MKSRWSVRYSFLLSLALVPNASHAFIEVGPNVRANSREICPDGTGTEQVEPTIALTEETVVVSYGDQRGRQCPIWVGQRRYQLRGWAFSLNGGLNFTDGGPLPEGELLGGDPWLVASRDGAIYLGGLQPTEPRGFSLVIGRRHRDGIGWSNPITFSEPMHSVDKDAMAIDSSSGVLYSTFRYGIPGGTTGIWLIRLNPDHLSFSGPFLVGADDDSGIAQGSFPLVGPAGEVFVVWKMGTSHDPVNEIRFAVSFDQGESFEPSVTVGRACTFLIDGSLSNALFPEFALDSSGGPHQGNLYLAWQTACPGEDRTLGDIVLVRSTDGGLHWTHHPRIVNDDRSTAHWFPSVTVDGSGRVNVFFYDRRANPGTTWTDLYLAQSTDGGRSFGPNVPITDVPSFWDGQTYGDYISSASAANKSFVTWTDARDGDPDIYVAWIVSDDPVQAEGGAP